MASDRALSWARALSKKTSFLRDTARPPPIWVLSVSTEPAPPFVFAAPAAQKQFWTLARVPVLPALAT